MNIWLQLKKHSLQCYRLGLWGSIGQTELERERAITQSGLDRDEISAYLEKGKREVEADLAREASGLGLAGGGDNDDDDDEDVFKDAASLI